MKVFISWSGEPSHAAAIILRDWLPVVLPFVDPWVSSEDIPKGRRWSPKVAEELDATNCGILCVTPSNAREPWLLFEAGALGKSVQDGRVHSLLLGAQVSDLPDPLSQFQATRFMKTDVEKLLRDINDEAGAEKISRERLDRNFKTCWPELEKKMGPLIKSAGTQTSGSTVKAATAPSRELDDDLIRMLKLVASAEEGRLFPKAAAQALTIHPELAKHHLEELQALGLVTPSYNYVYGTSWVLNKAGRAELVRRKLL